MVRVYPTNHQRSGSAPVHSSQPGSGKSSQSEASAPSPSEDTSDPSSSIQVLGSSDSPSRGPQRLARRRRTGSGLPGAGRLHDLRPRTRHRLASGDGGYALRPRLRRQSHVESHNDDSDDGQAPRTRSPDAMYVDESDSDDDGRQVPRTMRNLGSHPCPK